MELYRVIFAAMYFVCANANFNTSNEQKEIPDELDPKIINGREAEEGEFPWMVALHMNNRFICSSFLITPTVVMTAAHCVQFNDSPEPASAFFGIIGNNDRRGPETRIEFSEVVAHPSYGSGGSEGDIAVFRTTEPVLFTDKIQQICLPSSGREFEGENVIAMGWGVTSNVPGSPPPEKLMTTDGLKVASRTSCRFFFIFFGISITDKHVCVTSEQRSTGACYGDSGSSLVYRDPQAGVPLAIGVTSFGTLLGCGRPFVPTVYTATAAYTDWIKETLRDDEDLCFI